MRLWDEGRLRERVEAALSAGHGDLAPAARTVSTAARFLTVEQERALFEQHALPLLPLGDLPPEAGFQRVSVAGRSYLAARDAGGEAVLYANRCRHRGAELTCEAGARLATCPFHGWSYDVEGRARGIYGRHHGVEQDVRLEVLPSLAEGGFLWRAAESAELRSFAAAMGEFHGWRAPRVVRQFHLDGAFHWTIGVEAFLETYHFASAHRSTLGALEVKNVALFDETDAALRFTVPWRRPARAGESVHAFCHFMYFFFPQTFFLVFPDHFGWLTIEATGAERSRLTYRGLTPTATPDESLLRKVTESVSFLEGVKREDVALCESIQRGLAPGQTLHLTRYEPGLVSFHERLQGETRHLRQALAKDTLSPHSRT